VTTFRFVKNLFLISMLTICIGVCTYLVGRQQLPVAKSNLSTYWAAGKNLLYAWTGFLSESGNKAAKPAQTDNPQADQLRQAQSQLIGLSAVVAMDSKQANTNITSAEIKQAQREYEQANNTDDKRAALVNLVEIDPKNALRLLEKAHHDKDAGLRLEAIGQLFAFNQDKRAIKVLLSALNDADPDVVMEAVEGLANNPDKQVISALEKTAAQHPDPLIRAVATEYLAQVRDPKE
jgi:HEAT repeat protein